MKFLINLFMVFAISAMFVGCDVKTGQDHTEEGTETETIFDHETTDSELDEIGHDIEEWFDGSADYEFNEEGDLVVTHGEETKTLDVEKKDKEICLTEADKCFPIIPDGDKQIIDIDGTEVELPEMYYEK